MIIEGLQKLTLLDFPGQVACTMFSHGCNLRCPFCHNADLVLAPHTQPVIPEDTFFAFLSKRKGILEGVCITGGEPLLRPEFFEIMGYAHALGFHWGMTSNGTLIDETVANGAKIVVFPELCVTGYTCGDLFAQSALLKAAEGALKEIVADGCIAPHPAVFRIETFNS